MKQILLTKEVREMANEYATNLFVNKSSDFILPDEGLRNLKMDILEKNDGLTDKLSYLTYLDKIIEEYDDLKTLVPSSFAKKKDEFDKLLAPRLLSTSIEVRRSRLPEKVAVRNGLRTRSVKFFEEVVARMHYKEIRPVLAKIMMEKMGIQTCVYCNNAEATYSEEQNEAYYHLDHWMPKNEYPFLSVCFFNLYPCCANCNGHKLDGSKGTFPLYAELDSVADPFEFVVNRKAYEAMKPDTLKVEFNARKFHDGELCKEYNNVYRIERFYNAPTNLRQVEKLLYDIDNHRCSYPSAINASFKGILNKDDLYHFVLGIHPDEDNIFTDVKKKLKLDTARDMGLM